MPTTGTLSQIIFFGSPIGAIAILVLQCYLKPSLVSV